MSSICVCPKCGSQLELKFASGPRVSQSQGERVFSDTRDVGDLLEAVNMENLDGAELDFIEKTKERFAKYKDRIMLSDKQLAWLKKIAEKGF